MGRQPDGGVRSLCSQLLSVLFVLVVGLRSGSVVAQQPYAGDSYACSDSGKLQCPAFALYRAQAGYDSLTTIATLFNLKAANLTGLNKGVTASQTLKTGDAVLVPLSCNCINQTSYANVTHKIISGDTFYAVGADDFEYLTTTTATIAANPTLDFSDLQVGQSMVVPVRCGCPSLAQISSGVKSLVTYLVKSGDTQAEIGASFGVPTASVNTANELGTALNIKVNSTVLVPINTSQPNYTAVAASSLAPSRAPGAAPSTTPKSSSPRLSSSNIGVCIAMVVGVFAGVLLS